MSSLSIRIRNAINSGDIDTVYSIIDDEYSKNSKNPCLYDPIGYMTREIFTREASWTIPDPEAIENITDLIEDGIALEVGAGKGLWAALLKNRLKEKGYNGTIIATDDFSWKIYTENTCFTQVKNLSAVDAVNEHQEANILILSRPPFGESMAYDSLTTFKGDYVVYIGEGKGGSCADWNFYFCLQDEWEFLDYSPNIRKWCGDNDDITFYKRRNDVIPWRLLNAAIQTNDNVYSIIDSMYLKIIHELNKTDECVCIDCRDLMLHNLKYDFTRKVGLAIPDKKTVETISDFIEDKISLEVCVENGLWAALLKKSLKEKAQNESFIATYCRDDNFYSAYYTDVVYLSSLKKAVNEYPEANVLIFICESFNDINFFPKCLIQFKGNYIVYIGEENDSYSEEWKRLDIETPSIRCFPTVKFSLNFYERKKY
jgi:hypothetical protein